MNLAPLLPFAVVVGINAVLFLCGSNKHRIIDGNPTYSYPRGIAYFVLISNWGVVAFLVLLALSQSQGFDISSWIILLTFAYVGTVFPVYIYRFRLVLDRHVIRSGAFFFKEVPYADIVRVKYVQGRRSGQVILYTGSRKRMNVWETIGDFGSCVREIAARLPSGVTIPREGRMFTYLGDPALAAAAQASTTAAGLRARLRAWRNRHGQ